MNNETASREIESLDYYFRNFSRSYSEKSHVAMMTAIKALKQEPCEDCISRQAAIDTLEKHQYSLEYCKEHGIDYSVDMGMARIALNGLPSVTPKQEPCDVYDEYGNYKYPSDVELTEPNTATSMPREDAISRQAAIEEMQAKHDDCAKTSVYTRLGFETAMNVVKSLPSVTPKQRTGQWIRVTDKAGHLVWECDKCGWQQRFNTNFCPNCGANVEEQK